MTGSLKHLVGLALMVALLAACNTQLGPSADLEAQGQRTFEMQEVIPEVPLANSFTGDMIDETPDLWFVEFVGSPTAKGGRAAGLRNQRAQFRRAAAAEGIVYTQRFDYRALFNGLSVRASTSEIGKISQLAQVAAVYPVFSVPVPEPEQTTRPDMAFALGMTGADEAQNVLNLSGQGVRVGIIDTGIDLEHPDFGNRIQFGYDFVGDDFNADPTAPGYNPIPDPDPTPDDCQGHGTHVAGITGADGGVVGVAPGVTLGAYRVFGCSGSTTSDIIIAALELALADGMDVVNMSLGAAYQWPSYPSAQASNNLVDAGVVVVASAGNAGATGLYSLGAPGVGEKVIAVASFDNVEIALKTFEVGGESIGYSVMDGSVEAPESGSEGIVHVGRGCSEPDVVPADEYLADPAGKIALIERGACTFASKAQRAIDAGAVAVVIYNSAPGNFAGTLGDYAASAPVVTISQSAGQHIAGLSPATLTWLDVEGVFDNPTGNLISSFSSWGLSPDLTLKPDLGAPGGLITSTYPLEKGGYATLSGTSMSAPHVAGAVALYLEEHPATDAADVRHILQNTAEPKTNSFAPSLTSLLESPHRQGAGMINIPAAVMGTTEVTPGKVSVGELAIGASRTVTMTVRNHSAEDTSYTLTNNDFLLTSGPNTYLPYSPCCYVSEAIVTFGDNQVTVAAGGSATVDVTISNPIWPTGFIFGGYVRFLTEDGAIAASVPYSAFGGDYQELPILVPTQYDFPWLAKIEDGFYTNQEDGATFTMKDGDIAYVLAHFEHYSDLVSLEVVPADDRKLGRAIDTTYLELPNFSRNSTPEGFFAFQWDGTALVNGVRTPLPMGTYYLELTAEKALGTPDQVETWTSPAITISRSADKANDTGRGRGRN